MLTGSWRAATITLGAVLPPNPFDHGGKPMIADKDYYADADGALVDGSSPRAAFLVARAGKSVGPKYRAVVGAAQSSPAKAAAPAADKARKPKANKAKAVAPDAED